VEDIEVQVGQVRTLQSGQTEDNLRPVKFRGEVLGRRETYTGGDDTRGVTETLYKTEDGRLIVYVEVWSRWQGEWDRSNLHKVTEADLGVGGEFELLGRQAGLGRPLTLDEALTEV